MKKYIFIVFCMVLGVSVKAQQRIQLRSADKAECVKSDVTSLRASFSFSGVEAENVDTQRGQFSWLSMPNTVIGGNEGDPQIPVVNELIAVPVGARPIITVTSYSSKDYNLTDLGIKTLVPRQPSLRKDQKAEDVPFVYNEAAYQKRGMRSEPQAMVSVVGTMRGVQLGKMTIEPVSYDPVSNTLRVFNDIEVEVSFDGADAKATEDLLVETYSPYFTGIYNMLFNGRSVRSAYDDHPDLYTTPVKMLVVTTSTYVNSTPFQEWLAWKKQKGIDVDVQTVTSSTSSSNVRSLIQTQYNANHPTFLVIVGDESAVKNYTTWTDNSLNYSPYISDNAYASIDNDVYHDMFMSRMSVSSTTELGYLVDKIMMYEKYTMPDPSYLSNVLLIAGADSNWAPKVGRPTINYAADNYFNTAHGFSNVYKYVSSTYTGCFDYLSSGVGFANYTAHGDIQEWYSPNFTNSNVAALTNTNKYFWAMGNCCLTANWGNSSTYPCFGEAMIRAQNKGAFGYIGSIPESYWYEDYYFGVGATSVMSQTPSMSQTTTGVYDFMFDDTQMNTLNSVPFAGNVAVTYAHANSYTSSVSDEYYWRAYQCLGDGSVMPYHVNPSANTVSHASTISIGATYFPVSADNGSYVSITMNNEILGVAEVTSGNSVNVPISGLTSAGDVMVVVTRQQRQPYITTIQAISSDGPYISLDSYTPNTAHVGDETDLSITFKNVGTAATSGTTKVTLTSNDNNVNIIEGVKTFGALAANATITLSGFQFSIASGVADATPVSLHFNAQNDSESWEGDINITAADAVLEFQEMVWDGSFVPGQTITVGAKFQNVGHYQATNANITLSSSSNYLTIDTPSVSAGTLEVGQSVTYNFSVTISADCPETAQIPVTFAMNADGGISATGNGILKNSCMLYFNLADSYGDGWNGSTLTVSFNDGTESQTLTISSGNSASYQMEVGNGVHVTLTWSSGSQWDKECSFTVSYDDNVMIYELQANVSPSSGVLFEFDCNCAAEAQTFIVTATSSDTSQGTVSGGGEFNYGTSCTVTATPADGYMFTNWTMNGEIIATTAQYTFNVISDMNLVANFAEGNMIGDGGSATNTYLPSYNYYKYSLTEQIYTSDELGSAALITSIAFYNGGTEKTRTLDLYMKATTKSTFTSNTDWIAVSAGDKVFSGSVTMVADDWTTITFSSPFVYDGTSNVVLVTDDNTGSYTNSPHMACRVFDATSQALYIYNDNTNFDPASPSSYNGNLLSVKNQLLITKEPVSTEPVNITVSIDPEQAGTVSGGGEYPFGETCTVTVTPNAGYTFTGWIENGTVASYDLEYTFSATSDRNLVATFIQAIEIGEGTTTNNYLPSYNYYKYSMTEQIYTADEIGMAGTIDGIAFYNEGAEKTRTYDFYLKTTEKTAFSDKTDWIIVDESDKVFSGSVTMAANAWTFITFDTPFEYDGNSNIVLVADDDTGEYTNSPHMACSVYNTSESQAIYIYSDATNYDPSSPTTSQNSNYDVLSVKNHLLMHITASGTRYEITASAIPTDGGTVSGAGTYYENSICTLTATANEDYVFANWTKDGEVVSYANPYYFAVTEDAIYVANFTYVKEYTINAMPNSVEYGSVAFGSKGREELVYDFEDGTYQGWTLLKGNTGDSPNNWMHVTEYTQRDYTSGYGHEQTDGWMLSESYISAAASGAGTAVTPDNYFVSPQVRLGGSISFWVTDGNDSYGEEHFALLVSTDGNTDVSDFTQIQEWTLLSKAPSGTRTFTDHVWYEYTVDLSAYSGMGYLAIRHFDCYDMWLIGLDDITIVEGEEPVVDDGSISGIYIHGNECTVIATPNEDYSFQNWTEDNVVVSTSASYTFEVTSDRNLVANFVPGTIQTSALTSGWNNWSANVEITLNDLKAALVAAAPGTIIIIKSQTQSTQYNPNNGRWNGQLTSLDITKMYNILINSDCEITLTGAPINPDEHPVTISNGTNWIAFPLDENMSVTEAFSGFAVQGDMLKSQNKNAQYNRNRWQGQLNTLEPGNGYKYISNDSDDRIFTFPTNGKRRNTTDNNSR